ncbi:hypothetical protein TNCV_5094321 [Trichonephila clavipes]|nr:hypothetical protein TNCV_5094321 [Trichonephila clavipes]
MVHDRDTQKGCYTRAFGDGPHNFEPWSSDVENTPGRSHLGTSGQNTRQEYKGCSVSSTCQSTNHLESFTVGGGHF